MPKKKVLIIQKDPLVRGMHQSSLGEDFHVLMPLQRMEAECIVEDGVDAVVIGSDFFCGVSSRLFLHQILPDYTGPMIACTGKHNESLMQAGCHLESTNSSLLGDLHLVFGETATSAG